METSEMNKHEIFEIYHIMKNHPTNGNLPYRNNLFNIIVKNGWLEEYCEKYSEEFLEFGL